VATNNITAYYNIDLKMVGEIYSTAQNSMLGSVFSKGRDMPLLMAYEEPDIYP
jgi:hypothetical protein